MHARARTPSYNGVEHVCAHGLHVNAVIHGEHAHDR